MKCDEFYNMAEAQGFNSVDIKKKRMYKYILTISCHSLNSTFKIRKEMC